MERATTLVAPEEATVQIVVGLASIVLATEVEATTQNTVGTAAVSKVEANRWSLLMVHDGRVLKRPSMRDGKWIVRDQIGHDCGRQDGGCLPDAGRLESHIEGFELDSSFGVYIMKPMRVGCEEPGIVRICEMDAKAVSYTHLTLPTKRIV